MALTFSIKTDSSSSSDEGHSSPALFEILREEEEFKLVNQFLLQAVEYEEKIVPTDLVTLTENCLRNLQQ